MKKFKDFLNEDIAWQQSLSSLLFDLPRSSMNDVIIPISPSIFKRVFPETIRSIVFHLTDLDGLERLKKIQKTKKSISAFYNVNPDRIKYGVASKGGFIAELEADVLIASPEDLNTRPDKTGRRYTNWAYIINGPDDLPIGMGGGKKVKGIENDIEKMLFAVSNKYKEYVEPNLRKRIKINPVVGWVMVGDGIKKNASEPGKVLKNAISDYLDGMEKVIKKNAKVLRSVFLDYTKDRKLKFNARLGDFADWDELVVNNVSIKMIHVGAEVAKQYENKKELFGLPIMVWDNNNKMSLHIAKKVKENKK